MESARDIRRQLADPVRGMRDQVPDVFGAFAALDQAVMMDGLLSLKVKQLIALAIAVTKQCDGCIAAHARVRPGSRPPNSRWPRRWLSLYS